MGQRFSHHVAIAACLLILCAQVAADYLPADLRARVDALQASLDEIPTNQANAKTRARLLWQWLNAYAVDGGYVPVDATLLVSQVLAAPTLTPELKSALDLSIREFTILDQEPDALGTLTADLGPFTAGSMATVAQTYTVGQRAIQTGGGIVVTRHFMANFGQWQVNDPSAPNYISIKSNNSKVTFVATTVPIRGMHGGFRTSRSTLMFKLASGTLNTGDTVTITYGDTNAGSNGLVMPTFSSDRMPLPLYLAFTEGELLMSLPIQPIQVDGADVHGVAGFAPSIVQTGERFTFSVRAQDRFYNRATGDIPNWQLFLNGEPWRQLPSKGAITTAQTQFSEPGTYFISIADDSGKIRGEFNPISVRDQVDMRIFWGDTHGHSGFAEGIGTPERFMQWAREDARLDFVTHSEHDIWLDDAEWEVLRDNVEQNSIPGQFAAYLGYEWSVPNVRGGHHNVLFRNPAGRARIPAQFYPTLSELYQGLRNRAKTRDVVVIPHAHQAGDHRHSDPELEPLVEIMSQHGNFEWFARMYLKHGHQVGFIAASDNHLSQPGYSAPIGGSLSQRGGLGAIFAAEHSNDAIFDGMKALRAYATTGDRMILDFKVNDSPMGTRGPYAESRKITGSIIGTAPIDEIAIVKNDAIIWQRDYTTNTSDRSSKGDTFLITFRSESEPHHPGDNPRGWRAWEGTLEVINATLASIEPVDASFPLQTATPSEDDSNRITFATKTRGDGSSFLVRLEDTQRTTRLQFDLIETSESGGAPPIYREPQRIAATSYSLALRDMENGQISHVQSVDHYNDTTTVRRVMTDGARTHQFEYIDEGQKQGDYYFVRVTQTNDAIAWSSPVWIGGHRHR